MDRQEAIKVVGKYIRKPVYDWLLAEDGLPKDLKEALNIISKPKQPQPKTGRVMSVDDLEKGDEVFTVMPNSTIHSSKYILDMDIDDFGGIEYGNCFYDQASAEREVTRRKVVHKARQQFGDDVVFVPRKYDENEGGFYMPNVHSELWFFTTYEVTAGINNFIDSLSEEERESLR